MSLLLLFNGGIVIPVVIVPAEDVWFDEWSAIGGTLAGTSPSDEWTIVSGAPTGICPVDEWDSTHSTPTGSCPWDAWNDG